MEVSTLCTAAALCDSFGTRPLPTWATSEESKALFIHKVYSYKKVQGAICKKEKKKEILIRGPERRQAGPTGQETTPHLLPLILSGLQCATSDQRNLHLFRRPAATPRHHPALKNIKRM